MKNILTKISAIALLIISISAVSYAIYSQNKLKKAYSEVTALQKQIDSQKINTGSNNNKNLLATIGTLITLPTDEEPTIATVTDASKLENQPFFKNAQTGDKVFIYNKSKKAILFRPSTSKIIEYAPIELENNTNTTGIVAGDSTTK